MDLTPDLLCCRYIAVGTEEGSVRVIRYNEARTVRVGKATLSLIDTESHLNLSYVGSASCGAISDVKFGPDSHSLVAATEYGAVVIWQFDRE